jgi:DNA protecting protein DprA
MAATAQTGERIESRDILRLSVGRPLWWRGTVPDPALPRVAVVGSRDPTPEQERLARELGRELAAAGGVVVSGGAFGVDAAALEGALEVGGAAIAVLPSAHDLPFPPAHLELYERIAVGPGGLLSQVPPGAGVQRSHFLKRNLLIVQTVDALVTVCADARSGSLHCAGQAWLAGLPVLAAPWSPGSPNSQGSNRLLQAGARAITDAVGCQRLLKDLRDGLGRRLLERDPKPPGQSGGAPLDGKGQSPGERTKARRLVDGAGGRCPSYRAEAVTTRADMSGLADCDADLATRLVSVLQEAGPQGLPLEDLTLHLQADRGPVAALAMRLTLLGRIRRHAGGSFAV